MESQIISLFSPLSLRRVTVFNRPFSSQYVELDELGKRRPTHPSSFGASIVGENMAHAGLPSTCNEASTLRWCVAATVPDTKG